MAYRVDPSKVAGEVANLTRRALDHWNACLAVIAGDPFPRSGLYVERVVPIRPFRMRTFLYEITEQTSISGEVMFVLLAEFFPEYALVYTVNEDRREAVIFYLRPRR